jgi:hypothetical protein
MVVQSEDLELVGIVFVEKCYWYAHRPGIIQWNVLCFIYINGIVAVIFRIFGFVIAVGFIEDEIFVALLVIEICKPTYAFYPYVFGAIPIDSSTGCVEWVMVGNPEFPIPAMDAFSQPNLVFLYEPEKFFIGNRVLIPDNDELFVVFEKLRHVFAEQGKRGISNDDVRFFEYLDALGAAEIAVLLERGLYSVELVDSSVVVHVAHDFELVRGLIRLEMRGDELFKSEELKIFGKIPPEITFFGIVTITEDRFSLKMVFIAAKFLLDVGELGIELIVFTRLRFIESPTS